MPHDESPPGTLLGLLARRDDHPALIDPVSGDVLTHARLHEEIASVAGQLAGRLRDTSQRLGDLAFLDVAGRLAHVLLDLTREPDSTPHARGTVVRVSRQELARNIGCSREMAGRVLKKLEEDGMVQTQGRSILVLRGKS